MRADWLNYMLKVRLWMDVFEQTFKDYSDEEKKRIKEKHATEQDIAEANRRIDNIAMDIIKHYEKKIAPNYNDPTTESFKAQIVTVSRLAAAKYKEAIDRLNGPETAVVISGDNNDPAILKKI